MDPDIDVAIVPPKIKSGTKIMGVIANAAACVLADAAIINPNATAPRANNEVVSTNRQKAGGAATLENPMVQ